MDTDCTGSEFIYYIYLNTDLVASSFNLIASSFMVLVPGGVSTMRTVLSYSTRNPLCPANLITDLFPINLVLGFRLVSACGLASGPVPGPIRAADRDVEQ